MLNFLFLTSFAAISMSGLFFWWLAIGRLRRRENLIEPRPKLSSPLGLIDVAIMFVTWVAGQIGSTYLVMRWLEISPESIATAEPAKMAWLTLMVATGQLVSTACGILIIFIRYRRSEIFGWRPAYFWPDLRLGLLAFIMVVPPILFLQHTLTKLIEYRHSTLDMLGEDHSWLVLGSAWFAAVLVAPVCEEIFFRGILLAWLQRALLPDFASFDRTINGGWNEYDQAQDAGNLDVDPPRSSMLEIDSVDKTRDTLEKSNPYRAPLPATLVDTKNYALQTNRLAWWPVVVSAVIFAMVHIGQGPAPIPLFFLGLALGYLYQQTGSLLSCVVLHLGLNAFTMFWMTLPILFV